jgi:hypothetical protein
VPDEDGGDGPRAVADGAEILGKGEGSGCGYGCVGEDMGEDGSELIERDIECTSGGSLP